MRNNALIFIPDISGFTPFITGCKLEHSRQIIFSLIDIILGSNQMGLKLSEIEGDGVLFYLKDDAPEKEIIIQQAKKTFVAFHSHLKVLENNLFCDCKCGACETASKLTLKFIVHYGACQEVAFKGFMKLIGSDVILAHRLLKTSVPEREYILFSQQYLNLHKSYKTPQERWVEYCQHSENIKNFGLINSKYIPLAPLKES